MNPDTTHLGSKDLACLSKLAEAMNVSRAWLTALKQCANERHSAENPTCFTGTKSCKKWVMEWLERNRDFKTALVYPVRKRAA